MKTNELIRLEDRFGAKNYNPLDVILVKGKGIWVWDVEGKKYMLLQDLNPSRLEIHTSLKIQLPKIL
jgi:hypothetical protein